MEGGGDRVVGAVRELERACLSLARNLEEESSGEAGNLAGRMRGLQKKLQLVNIWSCWKERSNQGRREDRVR